MLPFFYMKRLIIIALFVIIPVLVISLYFFYNETNSGWSMQCTLYQFTGLQCPGCGGQRALHYLLHGNLTKALRCNVLFVLFLPFFLYLYLIMFQTYGLNKRVSIDNYFFSRSFGLIVLVITVLFVILRNISLYPFTLLSPPS